MRMTKAKAKKLARRAEKRAAAKTARAAQAIRARRPRRAIDRAAVFARDKGVCAICGVDTERLRLWLQCIPRRLSREFGRHHARALALLGRLWRVRLPLGARLWEADHVTPIAEGGSDELSNLRTLCKRCHRQESAALLGRLARRPTKGIGRGFA